MWELSKWHFFSAGDINDKEGEEQDDEQEDKYEEDTEMKEGKNSATSLTNLLDYWH